MARTSLESSQTSERLARLSAVDEHMARRYPGMTTDIRQPVHTCYVPANNVDEDTLRRWSREALAALDEHATQPREFMEILGLGPQQADEVHPRVRAKLIDAPVEDLRIDFEDGYGGSDEDADAERTAGVVAGWLAEHTASRLFGLRVKSFDDEQTRARSVRTLDIFLTELLRRHGQLPDGFRLTFPKIVDELQIEVFVEILADLESRLGLADGSLRFEVQVETPQSVVDSQGRVALPRFIHAGGGRVSGLHFGTYDYTASCGLTAAHQHMAHQACDFARHIMQVSAAGTGVHLSDGSTNVLPVGENPQVRRAWENHYQLVGRSLENGFYQGWDLHPAQLVTRYAAVFTEFRNTAQSDARRLAAYVSDSGGSVLDEPATARALAASFVRAMDNGATDAIEVHELTGMDEPEIRKLGRL